MNPDENERFWEMGVKEGIRLVDNQYEMIENRKEYFYNLIKIHLLFIGLVFTLSQLSYQGTSEIKNTHILAAIAPSVIAILVSFYGRAQISNPKSGFSRKLYEHVENKSDSYDESIKSLYSHYEEIYDQNSIELTKNHRYITLNYMLLYFGFGILTGIITLV